MMSRMIDLFCARAPHFPHKVFSQQAGRLASAIQN
ncbi:hypothetical protein Deipe_2619 [Deinococcus peraridilitoris DSM 19664]|uniref:Uncharacterized protein n=1 Tax=Deinococcus peraridilitoris (strain DSM 19664 / LMG 22246 / CIP 109416 / KR-200) TaxID=937777 RepID=L0A3S3_DEIPD|nr:hypothetical protein Deipe_2619 [Deinococcus peraridilitoris DSM 19664]